MRIEVACNPETVSDPAGRVAKLLSAVNPQHLVGLDAIVIVDRVTHGAARKAHAGGLYWPRVNGSARIEIAIGEIFEQVPRWVRVLPGIVTFMLAQVLYHEIGHHYVSRFGHGLGEREREATAEAYKRTQIRKTFGGVRRVLRPFRWLVRYATEEANRAR